MDAAIAAIVVDYAVTLPFDLCPRPAIGLQSRLARFSQLRLSGILTRDQTMKRRKQGGPPTARAPEGGHLGTKHLVSHDIVAVLAEQARMAIRAKVLAAKERRGGGKVSSKQPPLSEEMKDVTEIGGRRWKLGQTK